MPTREDKIAFIQQKMAEQKAKPLSREEKIAFIQQKMQEQASRPSEGESSLRGVEDGFTLGFADELAGGVEAAGQALGVKGLGANNFSELELTKPKLFDGEDGSLTEVYKQRRDAQSNERRAAREANPAAYTTGEIGGAIASGFIPGMAPARGAKLGAVAARSAAVGGAAGAGYSEADNFGDMAGDIVTGATIGAAVPVGLKGAGIALKGAGKLAKHTAIALGGVDEKVIQRYLENPARIRGAQSFDDLYEEVTSVVKNLGDDLDNKKIDYDFAKEQLDQIADDIKTSRVEGRAAALEEVEKAKAQLEEAFKGRKQVIADKASPSRIEPMVTDALIGLKSRVDDGVAVAEEVLAQSGKSVKTRSLVTPLRRLSNELAEDFSDDAVAAKAKLDKYINILKERGEELDLNSARRFMKNIRSDVQKWGRESGGHTGVYDRTLQKAQGTFDRRLKDLSPEYDTTMAGVAEDMGVLDQSRKLYGKDQTRLSRLEGAWRPSAKTQRETLEALAEKHGGEMPQSVRSMIDAQRTVKSPQRLEAIKQGLSETKVLRGTQGKAAVAKQMAKPRAIKEAIQRSAAFEKMKSTEARLKQAKELFNKFKAWGEQSAESKLKQVARGQKYATKTLTELSELADKDFVEAVKAAADAAAFTKSNFNGSRNTNIWSTIGFAALESMKGRGGAGAGAGFIFGGPIGLAIGGVIGGMMDLYGPRVTKKVLDGIIKIKGAPSEKAIMAFDVPEKVKLDLIQGFRNAITTNKGKPSQVLDKVGSRDYEDPYASKLKGNEKWAQDGLKKIKAHGASLSPKLLDNPKAKRLLISASSLKPGSKAMQNLVKKLETLGGNS